MATLEITFYFMTGINKPIFKNARLQGSWDANGKYSDAWTTIPMAAITGDDGCPAFRATIKLQQGQPAAVFKWGVLVDGPAGSNLWGMTTELSDAATTDRYRVFQLGNLPQEERFYFSYGRLLGANKFYVDPNADPMLQFKVWAPAASTVSVVFGNQQSGYIDDKGNGIDGTKPRFALKKDKSTGIWNSGPVAPFKDYLGLPYMFKIKNEAGDIVYRTDIFSRSQIGSGNVDPSAPNSNWPGTLETLNGSKSCSVIIDPDIIRSAFEKPINGNPTFVSAAEFWASEFDANRPVPTRVDDLVIYELHIGSLGFGKNALGTIADAIALLDYIEDLGVNAIELLPMADFSGNIGWGYGDTHHFVIQTAAGGRDKYRHFIRECHRRGIAVIQDVVYNHYDLDAGRCQWQYDSTSPEHNSYYWYQGKPSDYSFPEGGYIDNGSSGFAPNYREQVVRHQFVSSAVFLVEEMHVDGLRVDLTQALHRDNAIHANGHQCGEANQFGQKLLREWSRTLKMIRPTVMLIAEDHTGWDGVTKLPADGGLGFDAAWFVYFYHSLVGASNSSGGNARLLKQAGFGNNNALQMDDLAARLYAGQFKKVVYHESHDEAGNAEGSARTICVAVNNAAIFGDSRIWAEKRSRLVFGLSILSAATPMFLMGEEIGAQKPYTYNNFLNNREDLVGERAGNGAHMFAFYQDIIKLSKQFYAVRSHNIDILHVNDTGRVIAFKRYMDNEQLLIIASFNNTLFERYAINSDSFRLPNGQWKEIFNSDASVYGGLNVGNYGADINCNNGNMQVRIPAAGFIVLTRK